MFLYDAFFLWRTQPYAGSLNKPSVIRTLKPFLTMPALMDSSHVCKKYSLFFYFMFFYHILQLTSPAPDWRWQLVGMETVLDGVQVEWMAPLELHCPNLISCIVCWSASSFSYQIKYKGATLWSIPSTLTFLFPFFVHQPASQQADGQKTCCACPYCKTGSMFSNSSIKCLLRGLFWWRLIIVAWFA